MERVAMGAMGMYPREKRNLTGTPKKGHLGLTVGKWRCGPVASLRAECELVAPADHAAC